MGIQYTEMMVDIIGPSWKEILFFPRSRWINEFLNDFNESRQVRPAAKGRSTKSNKYFYGYFVAVKSNLLLWFSCSARQIRREREREREMLTVVYAIKRNNDKRYYDYVMASQQKSIGFFIFAHPICKHNRQIVMCALNERGRNGHISTQLNGPRPPRRLLMPAQTGRGLTPPPGPPPFRPF